MAAFAGRRRRCRLGQGDRHKRERNDAGDDAERPEARWIRDRKEKLASYAGHLKVLQALLAKGADVNAKMDNGGTALDVARSGKHDDVRDLFVQAGAK